MHRGRSSYRAVGAFDVTKSTHKDDALALLDELRADRRISSVEAQVLREGIDVPAVSLASPPTAVRTLNDLFDALGGPAAVGRAIGKGTEHAHSMKTRGSVPIAYWPKLIRACQEAGMQIDANGLLAIHLALNIDEELSALHRAIKIVGTQNLLAEKLGISQGNLSKILNGVHPLGAEKVIAIEAATGGLVTRNQLRPDLWPEVQP